MLCLQLAVEARVGGTGVRMAACHSAEVADQPGEASLGQLVPRPRDVGDEQFGRAGWQLCGGVGVRGVRGPQPILGEMPKLPPPPPVCAHHNCAVLVIGFSGGDHGSCSAVRVDDHDLDRVQVIDGQAVRPGQRAVAATDDVPARADRRAGAARNGDAPHLVQRSVDPPQDAPGSTTNARRSRS